MEEDVGLGSHGKTSKPSLLLPWHPPHGKSLTRHQTILDGKSSSDTRGHKPLDKGGFFRKPGFSDEHYGITAEPGSEAASVPDSFSALQTTDRLKPRERNKSSPSLEVSQKMAKDIEVQLRRSLRIESFQEWMFGTARALVQDAILKPGSTKPDVLPHVLGLLVSGVRALRDSNQVTTQLLHNLILLRRDALLDTRARDVPQEHVNILRRHSLADPQHLFDPSEIEAARKATLESRQLAVVTKAAKGHRAARPSQTTAYSPPRGSSHSSNGSFQGRNGGNRQNQWKGKGKKSPKPKHSPYRPKKGGGNNSGDK